MNDDLQKNEVKVSYRNDVCFKYALSGEDEISRNIRDTVIKDITGIEPVESYVEKTEYLPISFDGKKIVMDVHVKDKEGREYNIEMQSYGAVATEKKRFFMYLMRMMLDQLNRGNDYTTFHPTYLIIFVDFEMDEDHELINRYEMMKKTGRPLLENDMAVIYFVSLPSLKYLNKKVKDMTDVEKLCYLFKNEADNAILEAKEGVVDQYMKKYDDLQNDKDLWSYAVQSEIAEIRDRAIQQEMYDSGKADGKNEGLIEGKITTLQATLQTLIQAKYHEDAREWLLTLTPEQLEEATIHILSCDSLEILKTRLPEK